MDRLKKLLINSRFSKEKFAIIKKEVYNVFIKSFHSFEFNPCVFVLVRAL